MVTCSTPVAASGTVPSDFKLSFTGDIYLYMLVLSTDKVGAQNTTTGRFDSQAFRRITAAVFDRDENMLEDTGLW